MRKRNKAEGHESLDRWLLTYADMITLLMAFFIMMYSMSVLNLSKFREAAVSIRSGFGGGAGGQGRSILKSGGRSGKNTKALGDGLGLGSEAFKPLVEFIKNSAGKNGGVRISEDERGIVITLLSDKLLFDPGRAVIRNEACPILSKVAETLDKIENPIRIEGHTCNLPPRGSRYPSNWELSTARATNVLRFLVEVKGLDSSRFSAAGYGSAKPIARNNGESNRRLNRRVEIVILRSDIAEPRTKLQVRREEIRRSGD